MRLFYYSLILLFSISSAFSQRFPTILLHTRKQDSLIAIKLSRLTIDVRVTGKLATTTMDLTFYNANDRELEGQFYFPLGEGQTVSRFALDIDGHLREGVVVEKNRGQVIFEDVVRRQIDPGLLERVQGNNFKARIYPIPALGYKRVVIAYEQELIDRPEGYLYLLPLQFKDKVREFSVHVEVFKQPVPPRLMQNELTNLQFKAWHESYIADFQRQDYVPNRQLGFMVPNPTNIKRIFVYNDQEKQRRYFYLHLKPKVKSAKRLRQRKITLLWDVSTSSEKRDIPKELGVLDAYFKRVGNAQVTLLTFGNDLFDRKEFQLQNGNWKDLHRYLETVPYDGGTQLGVLDLNNYSCDAFILCSDGLSNMGNSEIKTGASPIFVISSSPNANHTYLRYLAQYSSGVYVDATRYSTAKAVEQLLRQPCFFMKAEYDTSKIAEVFPSMPVQINKDFSMAGQLLADSAKITLYFGDGKNIYWSKTLTINSSRYDISDPIVRRFWAQKKLQELDIHRQKNREEIIQLAKEYDLVTPFTSFLVLERLEDYLQYQVVPPEVELREQYFARLQKDKKGKKNKTQKHLENVVHWFQKRLKWWSSSKFPVEEDIDSLLIEGIPPTILELIPHERSAGLHEDEAVAHEIDTDNNYRERRYLLRSQRDESSSLDELISGSSDVRTVSSSANRIQIRGWDASTPYLKALKQIRPENWYAVYLKFRKKYANSPAFFFDVSDFLFKKKRPALALRVLSNVAEMEFESHELLRLLGYRLMAMKEYALAIDIFHRVLQIRPEEPQSYRDLALALEALGRYQQAVDLLYQVVTKKWDYRFSEIELIALEEMNRIIATCGQSLDLSHIDKRFIHNMPVDLRVVISWDANNTDIDLWVFDPNGEKCYYKHRNTRIGGHLSRDFTEGYGPEEFILHHAIPGKYKIKVHYYGNHRALLSAGVIVYVNIYLNYGTKSESHRTLTLRLKKEDEVFDVGEVVIKK